MGPNKQPDPHSDSSESKMTLLTNLSLFMMLLAFIIVMNTHTNFDQDKIKPILESVEQSFTMRVFRQDIGPSPMADIEKKTGDGYSLDELEQLFRASVPAINIRQIPSRGILVIEMKRDHFAKAMDSQGPSILRDRVKMAMSRKSKTPNQLEIWLQVPMQDIEKNHKNDIKTLSAWAQKLQRQGIDNKYMTVGLQPVLKKADTDKVFLLFRSHKVYGIK
jgi:hypothetical protein